MNGRLVGFYVTSGLPLLLYARKFDQNAQN